MSSLFQWLEDFAAWLLELLLWIPLKVFETCLELTAAVLEWVPVPAWLASGDPFAAIPDYVMYFLVAFELAEGITIILGAYVIRFMIRRLPIVG